MLNEPKTKKNWVSKKVVQYAYAYARTTRYGTDFSMIANIQYEKHSHSHLYDYFCRLCCCCCCCHSFKIIDPDRLNLLHSDNTRWARSRDDLITQNVYICDFCELVQANVESLMDTHTQINASTRIPFKKEECFAKTISKPVKVS